MRIFEFLAIFLKGMLMGAADILPGISGGTIAFITGIYERLIFGIRNIDFAFIPLFLQGKFKEARKNLLSIDFGFLIPLLSGIALSFLLLAGLVKTMLTEHKALTYAFFFGLIAGSLIVIAKEISWSKKHKKAFLLNALLFLIGFLFAFFFVALNPIKANHSMPVIFGSGIVAACAMLLPGISGAFTILLLGQYEFMLDALRSFNVPIMALFSIGLFFGFISFARVLAYLIRNNRNLTLAFLSGLMLGSLRLPLETIKDVPEDPILIFISAAVGFFIILLIERKANSKKLET